MGSPSKGTSVVEMRGVWCLRTKCTLYCASGIKVKGRTRDNRRLAYPGAHIQLFKFHLANREFHLSIIQLQTTI